ncbi:type I DNA topoisomerase [Anoxynatronum buryatiense]|uniref:DNA topoisomerase 1 n=1 Tax=Anoxynatronum buryatiense TaxID=489973 RepID=A0AA45WUB3_9CLOT|nr:type I DNA topoisomerase [Anoxynatronum buryatiense]SMP47145.1 DNA topoisomerase I [Anoxynatronum buryatiense]
MSKSLVIVESPAKAKTIKKFLGSHYTVKATVGHIIDLPKSKMGVDIDHDFEPQYITIRGKGPILNEIKKEAKKAKKVLLATDLDREGEAISWHLAKALNLSDEEPCRIVFNEITKNAIKTAVKNPRVIDKQLVDAQQARRVLDRLVGYKLSPLLWKKLRKGLSAGRVQSVATKMIKDREEEIKRFIPEEYWNLELDIINSKKDRLKVAFHQDENGNKKLPNQDAVDRVLQHINQSPLTVSQIKDGEKKRNPAEPFTTSTLQQEASNRIGFATRKTMMVAQQLYEGIDLGKEGSIGLITYLRTDSTRVSDEAEAGVQAYILDEYGKEYLNKSKSSSAKKKKQGSAVQDAHEAIRPTDVLKTPDELKSFLSNDQYKLYRLIWERFVSSRMQPARYQSIAAIFEVKDCQFKANGSRLIFDGFLKAYSFATVAKDQLLPNLEVGDIFDIDATTPSQHFTQPPARYTEASLVKAMEELGIGRPSTYAPTISTILSRGYVIRESKNLKPTELGVLVTRLLEDYFGQIIEVNFTAEMEKQLDEVEAGNEEWKRIIRSFFEPFEVMLKHADEHVEEVDFVEESDELCDKCGSPMLIKYGRYGKFLACSNYPECSNTKPFVKKLGIPCPICDNGEVVERKSKKGRIFYGCNQFPDCRFVSWNQPVNEKCPKCQSLLTIKKTKKETKLVCPDKTCGFEKAYLDETTEKTN